jgi:hypothetical protein
MARIDQLDLLRQLYGELVIPEAVWHEVVVRGTGQAGAEEVKSASWIKTQAVANEPLVQALQQELDAGEAEAIVLALETGADLLIMDERLGRENARHLGLRHIGLIGVFVRAKHQGLIAEIKPHLDALRGVAAFRIEDALYMRVLKEEGEL